MKKSHRKIKIKVKGIDSKKVGLSLGVFLTIHVILLWSAANTLGWGLPILRLMGSLYIGYETHFLGLVSGVFWAFIDGYIGGYLFAWIYNKL